MNQQEIAQLRSYLASQSMKKTPTQLIDMLQETNRQFIEALHDLPEKAMFDNTQKDPWSGIQILEHTYLFMKAYESAICTLLEQGKRPADVHNRQDILPGKNAAIQTELLADLEQSIQHLKKAIQQVDPDAHLDITWNHFELGAMHWREWLLFARVHLLDHVRQLQEQIS